VHGAQAEEGNIKQQEEIQSQFPSENVSSLFFLYPRQMILC
jgi:hypothetical protein